MNNRISSALAFAAVLLAGCGEPIPTDNKPAVPNVDSRKSAASDEAIAVSAVEEYFYNPAGKRDPFKPFYDTRSAAKSTVDENAVPLQRWDVDKFILSGVIWNTSVPRALLIDPEGTGHVIQMGTYVGRNWGKVTSISDQAIVVTEEYQTIDGELVVNPVTVHFPGLDTKK